MAMIPHHNTTTTQTFFAGVLSGLLLSASGLYGFCAGFFSAAFIMQKMDPWQLVLLARDIIHKPETS